MPQFYFHIIDGDTLIPDAEGQELPDLEAAQLEARSSARDLAIQELKVGSGIGDRKIEIADENGKPLESIRI